MRESCGQTPSNQICAANINPSAGLHFHQCPPVGLEQWHACPVASHTTPPYSHN